MDQNEDICKTGKKIIELNSNHLNTEFVATIHFHLSVIRVTSEKAMLMLSESESRASFCAAKNEC